VDWTSVVSVAITAAVGIAGVAGAIIAARIAGDSARESTRLTITAEADRARLADKRQLYARFMTVFSNAVTAAMEAKSAGPDSPDFAKYAAAINDAISLKNEVSLIAPEPTTTIASEAIDRLFDFLYGRCGPAAVADAKGKALAALRDDLDKEVERGG
jgi:hypothetical protein